MFEHFDVNSAEELDAKIRQIAALDNVNRGDQLEGTLEVAYENESVKQASLILWIESRGVAIAWNKKQSGSIRKGYLCRWKKREKPEDQITDYWFCFKPEGAAYWETRQDAENDCTSIYNRCGIDIETANGGKYHCRKFLVEEFQPLGFVVYCEAPFCVVRKPRKIR